MHVYVITLRNIFVKATRAPKENHRHRRPTTAKPPLQSLEVGKPFTFWALDYIGPPSETSRGNRHILVLMDNFTKCYEAFPTTDQKATTVNVAKILVEKVFRQFGPPVVLHSDQGAIFESNLMYELCDVMGITKTRTTVYHS